MFLCSQAHNLSLWTFHKHKENDSSNLRDVGFYTLIRHLYRLVLLNSRLLIGQSELSEMARVVPGCPIVTALLGILPAFAHVFVTYHNFASDLLLLFLVYWHPWPWTSPHQTLAAQPLLFVRLSLESLPAFTFHFHGFRVFWEKHRAGLICSPMWLSFGGKSHSL